MAADSDAPYLMLVPGEPDPRAGTSAARPEYSRFRLFGVFTSKRGPSAPPAPSDGWGVPRPVVRCVEIASEQARVAGRTLRVIDVNRPGEDRDLVGRTIRADDILPLLVAPDGRRLSGEERFRVGELRDFFSAPR